jgi:CheY-like chemotaxis protein
MGLGLTIARHLVELHNGKIYAYSAGEDKGATFTVKLPLLEEGSEIRGQESGVCLLPLTPSPQSLAPTLNGLQVLVVEDNTDTRDFIKIVLQQSGAEVRTVASVSEAMKCLAQSSPDVLLSDIGMPGEDGYQLIRQVRDVEQQRGGKIPAIALTAYARLEDRMQALSAGFQMHLSKPVVPSELVQAVAQLVDPLQVEPLQIEEDVGKP